MGAAHAVTGAAAWLAVAGTVTGTLGLVDHVDGPALAVGTVVAAGAALLPDIDHHNGTIAHSLPPVSNWAARISQRLSGGHRQGTHSILGLMVAVFGAFAVGPLQGRVGDLGILHVGSGVGAVLLSAFALRALRLTKGKVGAWSASLALAVTVVVYGADNWLWFPAAVGIGYLAHLLGDFITAGGIPVFWPIVVKPPTWWRKTPLLSAVWRANGNLALPVLGRTGSVIEWLLVTLLTSWFTFTAVRQWAGINPLSFLM